MRVLIVLALVCGMAVSAHAELPAEPIPNVLSLETPYPPNYAVVHDFAFGGLIDSKFAVVDTKTQRFKGMMSAGQFANIDFSVARQKFYVGETVHTRGTRGDRQDIVAIYDFENLSLQNEIDLPPKRMNVVVNLSTSVITDDDKFLLVFNMNPRTSVTVIDLDKEAVVNEIDMPGCTLLYPDAQNGFFSLCGNGGLVRVGIDSEGKETDRHASVAFNDIDNDPLSEKAARIGDTWFFITYAGEVQPVDASGTKPGIGKRWWLASEAEREAGYRPAGWHGKGSNSGNNLWVGMTPNGYEGSHKDPALEVWQFDTQARKLINKAELVTPALSIGVSKGGDGESAKLLVVNIEAGLDVYEASTGEYIHTIKALGDTPYMVQSID